MKKMFVGNLPSDSTTESVEAMFSEFGTVRSIDIAHDIFTGKCKGFGFVEMEGHESRAAIKGLNGKEFGGKPIRVGLENKDKRGRRGGRR